MTQEKVYATQAKPWLKQDFPDGMWMDPHHVEMSCNKYLWEHIDQWSKKWPDHPFNMDLPALSFFDKEVTFRQLKERIDQTAQALVKYGIKKGDIITCCTVTTPEIVYFFYALDLIGAIGNMVDPRTSTAGVHEYIEEVDSKLVVTLDQAYPRIQKAIEGTNVENVLVIHPRDSLPAHLKLLYPLKNPDKNKYDANVIQWKDFFKSGEGGTATFSVDNYDDNRGLLIVHTGGTTGTPKGVVLGPRSINSVSYQCDVYARNPGTKWLNVMPPFIAYGFCCGVHLPLSHGVVSIIIPNIDPNELGKLFLKYKPNYMAGVPLHYQVLAKDKRMKGKDISHMVGPYCGGDAMNEGNEIEVNNWFKEHNGVPGVAKGYGMTEAAALCCVADPHKGKIGSVGHAMGLTTIAVFEPGTDKEVPLNQEGEICITGPNLMIGYYNKPEETAKVLIKHSDGQVWAHTGDLGVMDSDGYVFIKSRIKRLIIRHDGFKIFCSVIEDAISKHPDINEVSAVAVKDKSKVQGNLPAVYMTVKDGATKSPDQILAEVKQICETDIPEYCLPTHYEILDKMPYTGISKIDYRSLEIKAAKDLL